MAGDDQALEAAKMVIRRIFNPRPISEREVTQHAQLMIWVLKTHGFKVVRDE